MTHATRPVGIPQAFRRLPWPSGTWLDCRSKEDYLCADRKKTVLTFRWFDRSWVTCGSVPVAVAVEGRFSRKGDEMTETLKVPQPARRRRGVTLIEAVLYIAISLALIVGGLVFYQQASVQSRTAAVVRLYSSLIAEARIVRGEATSLSDTSFEDVINARGSIPPENWDATMPDGQRLRLPFPGMYASIGANLSPTYGSRIFLTQYNMPVSLCSRLFAATFGSTSYANGAFEATFFDENGAWAYPSPALSHRYDVFPTLSPAGAATLCRNADLNGNGLVRARILFSTAD
jgi:type II secretory pathway pseudopilin PulG